MAVPTTIPKKALVALQDLMSPTPRLFKIVPPEEARVSAFDRSFHFGDSLYEVTRSYNGILFSLEEHLSRLKRSAELAMWETPPNVDELLSATRDICRAFFSKFGNTDIYIRHMVSRGISDLNIDRKASSEPYSFIFVKALEPMAPKYYDEGLHYAVVSRVRNLPSALDPAMKSGNYLNNILAMAEARRLGADDAVILNYQGFVTEGTTNNIFAVKDGELWTPPLSVGILAGITRNWIFELCRREGIKYQERLFTAAELASCDEVFMSSSVKEIMPITKLTGRPVGNGKPGAVTRQLHAAFKDLVAEWCKKRASESLYV